MHFCMLYQLSSRDNSLEVEILDQNFDTYWKTIIQAYCTPWHILTSRIWKCLFFHVLANTVVTIIDLVITSLVDLMFLFECFWISLPLYLLKNIYWTFIHISSKILFKILYVFLFGYMDIKGASILWIFTMCLIYMCTYTSVCLYLQLY